VDNVAPGIFRKTLKDVQVNGISSSHSTNNNHNAHIQPKFYKDFFTHKCVLLKFPMQATQSLLVGWS
jgi:hypothetical protein